MRMKKIRMESIEGKTGGFGPVGCEIEKGDTAANNSISDHAGIILDALNDYRRWFSGNDDSDKEIIKLVYMILMSISSLVVLGSIDGF